MAQRIRTSAALRPATVGKDPLARAHMRPDLHGVTSKGFLVSGRVQGVGFRWWTTRQARALGLSGTVRNLSDGSVEIHVSGQSEAVGELHRRLERGPRAARVTSVTEVRPAIDLPADFVVLH
jgi:acylphosphatase